MKGDPSPFELRDCSQNVIWSLPAGVVASSPSASDTNAIQMLMRCEGDGNIECAADFQPEEPGRGNANDHELLSLDCDRTPDYPKRK